MKKILLFAILTVCFLGVYAQVDGDYRTGTTNVTWSTASDWQVRSSGSWSTAGTAPGASNNVWIQSGHNVILTSNAACNTLNHSTNTTGLATLNLQTYNLEVNGDLRGWRQGSNADGTNSNQGFNANSGSDDLRMPGTTQNARSGADWLQSTTGRIVIVGTTRTMSSWGSSNAITENPDGYNLEFAPAAGNTISLTQTLRAKNIYFTSGTVSTSQGFYCSQTTVNTGEVIIESDASVVFTGTGSNLITRNPDLFGFFQLLGTLEITNTDYSNISSWSRTIGGTIILSKPTGIQRWPNFAASQVYVNNFIMKNGAEKRKGSGGYDSLYIQGDLIVESGSGPLNIQSADIYIESGASMVFEDGTHMLNANAASITGPGNVYFTRNGHAGGGMYNYWSTPMSTATTTSTLGGLAADIYRLPFNSASTSDFENFSGTMELGRGYTATTNGSGVRTFIGKPNLAQVNTGFVLASGSGYSLLGNPYPSAIDADLFYTTNSSRLSSTFYYWAQTMSYQQAGSFSSADYASYNAATATGVAATGAASSTGAITPNNFIDACQGFLVEHRSGAAGTAVLFNNSHRSAGPAAAFYKDDLSRFWVNVQNGNLVAQTALVLKDDATNNFDEEYDSPVFPGEGFKVFSQVEDKDIVINAVNKMEALNDGVTVPVTIQDLPSSGEIKFTLAKMENTENLDVYLYDAATNKVTDLRANDYTVVIAEKGTVKNRFHIGFKGLNMDKASENINLQLKSYIDYEGKLVIDHMASPKLKIGEIRVYNTSGQLVAKFDGAEQAMIGRYQTNLAAGIYIINVNTNEGVSNSKVLLK